MGRRARAPWRLVVVAMCAAAMLLSGVKYATGANGRFQGRRSLRLSCNKTRCRPALTAPKKAGEDAASSRALTTTIACGACPCPRCKRQPILSQAARRPSCARRESGPLPPPAPGCACRRASVDSEHVHVKSQGCPTTTHQSRHMAAGTDQRPVGSQDAAGARGLGGARQQNPGC